MTAPAPCRLCPRDCGAARFPRAGGGVCGMGLLPRLARAAPHFGEEPCISGTRGTGAIFFSGCALGCVFCQNREISRGGRGEYVGVERLAAIMLELQAAGVHNLSLVTAGHFLPGVRAALRLAGPRIPVVYNSSGYERPRALAGLLGLVQVYLPDLKYLSPAPAARYSGAADYPEAAKAAIAEMYRQTGPFELDADGLLTRGVLIRHLVLPGEAEVALDVVDWVADTFPKGAVMLSMMAQYTPMPGCPPELGRPLAAEEYERVLSYFSLSGLPGYFQDLSSSGEAAIPLFDMTGVWHRKAALGRDKTRPCS